MFKTLLLKQSIKWMLAYILPSKLKCFMYIFTLIATVWASIAGYYYFSEDYLHYHGAIVSVGIFGILALIALIWDYYFEKSEPQEDILTEVLPKYYLLLKVLYDQFKDNLRGKNIKGKLSLFVPISIAIYLFIQRRKIVNFFKRLF